MIIFGLGQVSPSVAEEAFPTDLEIEIHKLINYERAENGRNLPVLKFHSDLIYAAREHSKDMLENGYFEHVNPFNGEKPSDRVSEEGISHTEVRENLYYSYGIVESQIAEDAVQGWIDSQGHYVNMMSSTKYTGIGIASSGGVYYITQLFINADADHLLDIGIIYDNENFEGSTSEQQFYQHPLFILVVVVVLVVIIGKDAEKRTRKSMIWNRTKKR